LFENAILRTYRRARPPFGPGSCSQDILNSQFRGEADLILLVRREHSSPRSLHGSPIVVAPYRSTTSIPFFAIFAEDSLVSRPNACRRQATGNLEVFFCPASSATRSKPRREQTRKESVCEGKAELFALPYAYQTPFRNNGHHARRFRSSAAR